MDLTRRSVLTATGLGALGVMGYTGLTRPLGNEVLTKSASGLSDRNFPRAYRAAFRPLPRLAPYEVGWDDGVRVEKYAVSARVGTAQILPNLSTPVIGYNGSVPGPTISVERGTRVHLKVRNRLYGVQHPEGLEHSHESGLVLSTHLHGHASLPEYDGYADDRTIPGYAKEYVYENDQPARTIWYHDHATHLTTRNVYSGLAAQYHIRDEAERALLPQGEFDVAMTLSDIMFESDGRARFDDKDHSGLWGDVVLVNGQPWPVMKVKRRVYRFRVLNASISRSYRPYLSTGDAVHMVATDGGLMPTTRSVTTWRHAPAERYEFLVDFSRYAPGTQVNLLNSSNPKNVDFDHTGKIMAFQVVDDPVDTSDPTWRTIPTSLVGSEAMSLTPSQSVKTRYLELKKSDVTNVWNINGTTWQDVIASGYTKVLADPGLHSVEMWDLHTSSGGWFHPLHIHLVDFQIVSRNGKAPFAWERGPKDVVYVGPDEKVRVLMRFEREGRYMVHCHNLPHEDHDMMGQFRVGLSAGAPDPHDPIAAARPAIDTEPDDR
ncbi:multicopper oxidase family protein [Serinicoccus chungangensis]|uniref:multicopper oxidase family protein n=1 Tax=Serinicoccus chungangensis TaxID=767452 RepID=UPI00111AD0DD|nr:multicopper oxidase family protein [Serinicoccus chungangensis]